MSDKGDGEAPDDSQKTEDPTQKKLDESRKSGQVPLSREANTWLMLFAGAMIVLLYGPTMMSDMTTYLTGFIEASGTVDLATPRDIGRVLSDMILHTLGFLALPFLIFILVAIAGPVLQVGFLVSAESLKPSLDKIDIMKGAQRIFSMKSVIEFLKGILKLVIIGTVSTMVLMPILPTIDQHIGQPIPLALNDIKEILQKLLVAILSALFLLAVFDVAYVRLEYNKRMRMTKQEIKDEYKQTEGDPHVKARLRQMRIEKGRKRMIQAVPTADVVITNPTHYAIALKYDPNTMDAPQVVAKGVDAFALRIREVATEHKVSIVENPPLARSLWASVEVDETIPADLYKAVAEVISYVFRLKGKIPNR